MKLGIYTDPHFCSTSSILIGKDAESGYSLRLSNLIQSFKWMNDLFESEECDHIISLGDTTDKSHLNAEEITAMSQCNLESHILLLGNHCIDSIDGTINSVNNYNVISEPTEIFDGVLMLPYNKTPYNLSELYKELGLTKNPKIILSHNDISQVLYTSQGYYSDFGYNQSDILNSCELFINGHIHTASEVVDHRIINLGSLTGLNFNSSTIGRVMILDTESLEYKYYNNPYSLMFLTSTVDSYEDVPKLNSLLSDYQEYPVVLKVKVMNTHIDEVIKLLDQYPNILAHRINITYEIIVSDEVETDDIDISTSSLSIFERYIEYLKGLGFGELTSSESKLLVSRLQEVGGANDVS